MVYFQNLTEMEEVPILLRTGWHMENNFSKDRVPNGILSPDRYYTRLPNSKEPHMIRLQVVIHYFTNGFNKSFTAQAFGTTTKTVRKLVRRYKQEGEEGLKDKSRRPHTSPKRADTKLEVDTMCVGIKLFCILKSIPLIFISQWLAFLSQNKFHQSLLGV